MSHRNRKRETETQGYKYIERQGTGIYKYKGRAIKRDRERRSVWKGDRIGGGGEGGMGIVNGSGERRGETNGT